MMNCEEAKSLLTKYLLGDLDEAQASAVRAHLKKCDSCSAEAAEIQPTLDLLREALSGTEPAPAKLDVDRHVFIYAEESRGMGRIIDFVTADYPAVRRLASVLVICLLIGLLAAISLPSFSRARSSSRGAASMNNLRMVDAAIEMYKADNEGADPSSVADISGYMNKDAVVGPLSGEELSYNFGAQGHAGGIVAVDEGKDGSAVLYGDGRVEYEKNEKASSSFFKMGEVVGDYEIPKGSGAPAVATVKPKRKKFKEDAAEQKKEEPVSPAESVSLDDMDVDKSANELTVTTYQSGAGRSGKMGKGGRGVATEEAVSDGTYKDVAAPTPAPDYAPPAPAELPVVEAVAEDSIPDLAPAPAAELPPATRSRSGSEVVIKSELSRKLEEGEGKPAGVDKDSWFAAGADTSIDAPAKPAAAAHGMTGGWVGGGGERAGQAGAPRDNKENAQNGPAAAEVVKDLSRATETLSGAAVVNGPAETKELSRPEEQKEDKSFAEKIPLVGRLFARDSSPNLEAEVSPTVVAEPAPVKQAESRTDSLRDADEMAPARTVAAERRESPAGGEKGSGRQEEVRKKTLAKLEDIKIPEVDFRAAKVSDVVEFLEAQTKSFDKETDGSGVAMQLELAGNAGDRHEVKADAFTSPGAPVDPFAAAEPGQNAAGDVNGAPTITFSAREISAKEALDIVTSVANLQYEVTDEGVKVVPRAAPESNMVHREYDMAETAVPGNIADKIKQGGQDTTDGDWKEFFAGFGAEWPAGSSVKYLPQVGKLFVANTPDNLERFEKTLEAIAVKEEQAKEDEAREATRFKAYGVNPVINVSENAFSTFSIDVDTASYTLTRNYIIGGHLPPAESVRTEEVVNFFDYAYKAPEQRTFAVYAEAAPSKFGRGQHLLKIGVKGRRIGREEERPAVLTFLIDTSGSMEKPDRIGLVKKSLRMLVEKLGENDRVSIIQYDSQARLVLAHTPAKERQKIIETIDALQCSGSTDLEQGIDKAYETAARGFVSKGENRVLILSDGVANLGSLDAEAMLAKVEKYRRQGIFCSVFGLGMGTYDDVMLETLANKGDGTYAYLDSEEEAKRLFVDDLSATLNTIAKDVKIQVEFNRNLVSTFRQLGYENRQLTKEQFRDDTVDAGEVGSGQSVTALYEIEMKGAVSKRLGPEPAATVRVRYRRTDNDAIEEIEVPVTFKDFQDDFNKTDARFKLAACAAEFAEILRGSPYAQGSDYSDVSAVLRPVALELSLDQRVQEFLRLTTSAPGMARGQ